MNACKGVSGLASCSLVPPFKYIVWTDFREMKEVLVGYDVRRDQFWEPDGVSVLHARMS